jgi:hypothetical protein
MCALRLSTDLKNYIVNQGIVKQMAGTMGTGGTCVLQMYSGTQPATADAGTSGTLLATIIGIGWGGSNGTIGATSGTSAFGTAAGYTGTAATSGTIGWARLETVGTGYTGSAATHRIDGDVGTAATSTFVVNSCVVTALGAVSVLSMPISVG